jgi:uncharacterized integral membrane protein (TIGR00698 family)
MIAYPMVARWLGLDEHTAGIFLGGTIHDVAQVVGAGYSLSRDTGDVATLVKLLRVAMLLPVIVFAAALTRSRPGQEGQRPPLLPWFVVAFAALVAVNSVGWVSPSAQALGSDVSRWFLVAAIAGVGMKTQLKDVLGVGIKPVALMVGETLFLASLVLGLLHWSR